MQHLHNVDRKDLRVNVGIIILQFLEMHKVGSNKRCIDKEVFRRHAMVQTCVNN